MKIQLKTTIHIHDSQQCAAKSQVLLISELWSITLQGQQLKTLFLFIYLFFSVRLIRLWHISMRGSRDSICDDI